MDEKYPEELVMKKLPVTVPKEIMKICSDILTMHFACNSMEINAVPHANSFWFNCNEELDSKTPAVT